MKREKEREKERKREREKERKREREKERKREREKERKVVILLPVLKTGSKNETKIKPQISFTAHAYQYREPVL